MTLISGASPVFVPCLVKVHVLCPLTLVSLPSQDKIVLDVQPYDNICFTNSYDFTLWAFFKNFYLLEA